LTKHSKEEPQPTLALRPSPNHRRTSAWLLLLVLFPLLAGAGQTLRVAVISDLNGVWK
jgi:hypothetical protein